MRKLLVMVAASVAFGAHADVFYVDSVNGNDDWDGSADYAHRDESATPVGDTYAFDGTVGETVVTIAYAGDGKATVSSFALPVSGLLLIFK